MSRDDLFLRNCAGEVTKQKPVWIMRQAGRYLTEYKEVRNSFPSFIDFYKNPEACAKVTLQPIDKFGLDAAILFSDILTLLPPLGIDLEFVKGRGPVISNPVETMDDVNNMLNVDVEKDLHFVGDAIKLILKQLDGRVPLLGFAGGPLTVGSYIVEGGSSKELAKTKEMAFGHPEVFHALMDKITSLTIEYLKFQVECGAQVIVVMDSWAGYFSPGDYETSVFPYTQKIFTALREYTKVPLFHYANGAGTLIKQLNQLNCHALGLDWRVDIEDIITRFPDKIYQGNLDPCALYGTAESIEEKAKKILKVVENRPHIMNLGHGVLPTTPVAGVEAFLKTIRNF